MWKDVVSYLLVVLCFSMTVGVVDAIFFANAGSGTVRGGPSKQFRVPLNQYVSAKSLFQQGNSAVFVTTTGQGLSDEFVINDNVYGQGIIQHNAGVVCVNGNPPNTFMPNNPIDSGVWISNTTSEFMFSGPFGGCTIFGGPDPLLIVLFALWD